MKKLIIALVFSIAVHAVFSQNSELLQESCRIILKNKKIIKDARLWSVQFNRIEYEKEGSLHDLLFEKIERIETEDHIIDFDKTGKLSAQPWDLIIKNNSDSVKCIIDWVNTQYIGYHLPGKSTKKSISKTSLKKYICNGKEVVLHNESAQSNTPSVVVTTTHKPYQTTYSIKPIRTSVPNSSSGLVAGEVLAGGAMGYVGAMGGGLAGGLLGLASGSSNAALAIGVVGAAVGYTLGTAGGVHMAGSNKQITGRYGSAVGGAIGGIAAGAAIIGMAVATESDGLIVVGVLAGLAAPSIGATIAYNNTRKYRNSDSKPNLSLGITPVGAALTYKF